MRAVPRIHWGRIVLAGLEVAVLVIFFVLLIAATLAEVPRLASPMSPLVYADALVSSLPRHLHRAQPPLYLVAHVLKVLGGITGGTVVQRRKRFLRGRRHRVSEMRSRDV